MLQLHLIGWSAVKNLREYSYVLIMLALCTARRKVYRAAHVLGKACVTFPSISAVH